ncbi:MAG: alpha/beta hydrolase [Clostridiaceae bacterium]|nr:alpha/beta hydrolase [Clostridiaceae bacterium]
MKTVTAVRYANAEPCLLDLWLPDHVDGFTTVVMIHGGGLENGSRAGDGIRENAEALARCGIATVSPDYRMFPVAKYPDFVEDAAAVVAWVKREIASYGGSGRVYVGGLSAGAYLSMMLCFDHSWLANYGIAPLDIAGYLHGSAQPTKHFNVLKYSGDDPRRVVIDETAPIFHITPGLIAPPMQILVSDDDITNRRVQNELLVATLAHMGFNMQKVDFRMLHGTHCSFAREQDAFDNPVYAGMILEFMRKYCGENV